MRTRDDGDLDDAAAYNRGWEWWLLAEAKKRNPALVTMALSWGVPGWIGNQTVSAYWSDDNIDFHVRWVRGLWKHHGIQLDWLGIWNEVDINAHDGMAGGWDWVLKLRAALDAEPDGVGKKVKLLADDTVGSTGAACSLMLQNQTIRDALAGLANHYDWETRNPGAECERLRSEHGKALWVSEGAASAGLGLNHAAWYGNVSGYTIWPFALTWYPFLPFGGEGGNPETCESVLCGREPWGGYWGLGKTAYQAAHTTQFTTADGKCAFAGVNVTGGGGKLIANAFDCGPAARGYSVVLISTAEAPMDVTVHLSGPIPSAAAPLALWGTCGDKQDGWFQELTPPPTSVTMAITLQPGCVYTLTTAGGGGRPANTAVPPSAALPLPFADDFEDRALTQPGRYWEDIGGTFEVAARAAAAEAKLPQRQSGAAADSAASTLADPVDWAGGGAGQMLAQVAEQRPVEWEHNPEPYTIIGGYADGDNTSWTDYTVAVSAAVTGRHSGPPRADGFPVEYVRACGRISTYVRNGAPPLGYCLSVGNAAAAPATTAGGIGGGGGGSGLRWFLTAGGNSGGRGGQHGCPSGPSAGGPTMCGPEEPHVLASGAAPPPVAAAAAAAGGSGAVGWLRLSLSFNGSNVTAAVNGTEVASVSSDIYRGGAAAVGSGWHTAAFDDFACRSLPAAR
jgi:hypothetical protein